MIMGCIAALSLQQLWTRIYLGEETDNGTLYPLGIQVFDDDIDIKVIS